VSTYEQSHGIRPNLVFMNETHYSYLREELPGVRDHDDVTNIIGVDIALSDEAVRPHVATVTFGGNHILVELISESAAFKLCVGGVEVRGRGNPAFFYAVHPCRNSPTSFARFVSMAGRQAYN